MIMWTDVLSTLIKRQVVKEKQIKRKKNKILILSSIEKRG